MFLVNSPGTPVHRVPIESRPQSYTAELRSGPPIQTVAEKTKSWCFYCATPWNLVNSDMQQAMRNLLEIRRSRFPPTSFIRADCSNPKNVSALPRQECTLGYCQTLTLIDHDSGRSSFPVYISVFSKFTNHSWMCREVWSRWWKRVWEARRQCL
jgi:hypothetical protein